MGNGTSIGRVRGLGSAKTGAHHWLVQRFTAIGNLLLVLWLAVSILLLPDMTYASVSEWLSTPVPATAMALLVVSTFWHARIGLQVVVEDYVHEHANKFACIAALNLAAFAGAAFGVFCVVRLALGAHA
ncbi:succinate dehydrogenase, hydrophobic membrane anchor protein [Novosphingobium sp. PY1]|uniref:succinate dehydrogenase, hydrophobic membrane anchor protein n=1 Tax=Novosphingobium sp. PY1 TaxID=1882221 RepID=UPI000BE78115|nr:succinate dehydrogenase, hydrophobic membrane anchor protein [Novosphingobium sp. PY1]BBA73883.1 succinate dehydrogenase hydrophobic membrane anchor protein [Novosphingobium sp. PY1]GFM31120.1 succinate dehydrogenase hydrophobic membrane anchor protein [Novosphingobium sp. PY1]